MFFLVLSYFYYIIHVILYLLYYTILYYIMLYYILLNYITLYYIMLYYIISCYIISYHTILYYMLYHIMYIIYFLWLCLLLKQFPYIPVRYILNIHCVDYICFIFIEGSLEAKLPTIWKDGTGTARKKLGLGESQKGEGKRWRKSEERRCRNTVFFQCFVAREGRKVGSLKRRVRR